MCVSKGGCKMNKNQQKRVFVTVGTTKFEKLIDIVGNADILNILSDLGFNFIQFQTGTGEHNTQSRHDKITMKYDKFFDNFTEQIQKADLILSHAGAGSCLEVLKQQKPLIVVINEDLMDNHQTELAEELQSQGYLQFCTTATLKDVLLRNSFHNFKPYPKADEKLFANYLDKCMGL